jgi:NAD-dependent dihydropyrimidine dehydrogenase PreA subunit
MENRAYITPNPMTPNQCVVINRELCSGCNSCVNVCRSDVLLPGREKGEPPIVVYPDECWYCGCCVEHCPVSGAISMEYPLNQRVGWKRKATGEYYHMGMKNPLPPNEKPPLG